MNQLITNYVDYNRLVGSIYEMNKFPFAISRAIAPLIYCKPFINYIDQDNIIKLSCHYYNNLLPNFQPSVGSISPSAKVTYVADLPSDLNNYNTFGANIVKRNGVIRGFNILSQYPPELPQTHKIYYNNNMVYVYDLQSGGDSETTKKQNKPKSPKSTKSKAAASDAQTASIARKILKSHAFKKILQTTLASGAAVGTGGVGGEEIVNVIFMIDKTTEFIKDAADMAITLNQVYSQHLAIVSDLKKIVDIDRTKKFPLVTSLKMTNDPMLIKKQVTAIFIKMVQNKAYSKLIPKICSVYLKIASDVAEVITDWLTAFIPGGTVLSFYIESKIKAAIKDNGYATLMKLMKKIPNEPIPMRDMIYSEEKMKKFIKQLLRAAVKGITEGKLKLQLEGDSGKELSEQAEQGSSEVLQATSGLIQSLSSIAESSEHFKKYSPKVVIKSFLENQIIPQVDLAVHIFHTLLPIFIGLIAFLDNCSAYENGTLKIPKKPASPKNSTHKSPTKTSSSSEKKKSTSAHKPVPKKDN